MATIVKNLGNYFQMGEALAANDAVYISGVDGKIYKFDVTDNTQVFAGFAKEAGVLDDWTFVSQSGSIKGFVGLTPGAFVYASTTVPGSFQLLDPGPAQKIVFGIAKSATELTINGGLGIKPGGEGGGGGLDVYYIENMEGLNDTSDFATGNNATFLGGGTLQGTLAVESVSPISGLKSLKYTQAAGSLNDYFASDIIDIDLKQQNNDSGMTLYFEYSGADNDMNFVVWDVTNNQRLSSETAFVKLTGKATRYSLSFYVPTSCTQIRWGAQVVVENIGAELVIDDVEISTDPFMEGELLTQQSSYLSNPASFSAVAIITGALTTTSGAGLYSYNPSTGVYTVLRRMSLSASYTNRTVGAAFGVAVIVVNGTARGIDSTESIADRYASSSYSDILNEGSTFWFRVGGNAVDTHQIAVSAIAATEHVLAPVDTFSTDTAPLTYAGSSQYTLSTLANAPVGTFITFTYAINTNTRTQTNAAPPSQSTSDMNVNGIQIFTRAYNAASTSAQPVAIAIQIGKGLKGTQLRLYKSAGKVTSGDLDFFQSSADTICRGARLKDYNDVTGILYIDSGFQSATITTAAFDFSDLSNQTNGYLTINASKSAALTAVPTPLVAYLKDVKTSGTAGGTFTSGAWQTRTLNTLEGDTSFVTLSANQFTLPTGRYEIEASAPGVAVSNHQSRLYNITTASLAIGGSSEYAAAGTVAATSSVITGSITINSSSTFEIQHYGTATRAADGFGVQNVSGIPEVYTQVKIKKVG